MVISVNSSIFVGETIEAKHHENVTTMLFSDIVDFTSIYSSATPFMVISINSWIVLGETIEA